MLHTKDEYIYTLKTLNQISEVITQQKANLRELGLRDDQVEKAIHPSICFRNQLQEEIDQYKH